MRHRPHRDHSISVPAVLSIHPSPDGRYGPRVEATHRAVSVDPLGRGRMDCRPTSEEPPARVIGNGLPPGKAPVVPVGLLAARYAGADGHHYREMVRSAVAMGMGVIVPAPLQMENTSSWRSECRNSGTQHRRINIKL
ncbi:hypothetical protein Bbelb_339000 [Branchiostoma belcheri]|nr:hypothetical protein Bbelb_339000 [Branchiostoma belcheri]